MIGGIGEPGYFVYHDRVPIGKLRETEGTRVVKRVGPRGSIYFKPKSTGIALNTHGPRVYENSQKSDMNTPDSLSVTEKHQAQVKYDLKDSYSSQYQNQIGHPKAVTISGYRGTILLPQNAIEGIKHAAFGISGITKDEGTSPQPRNPPTEQPKPKSISLVISPVPLKKIQYPSNLQLPSLKNTQEPGKSLQAQTPSSRATAALYESSKEGLPQPVNTQGNSSADKVITPSSPPKASPSTPKTNGSPTFPSILLARPLKYFDEEGDYPHLHAGKLKLFVPTGVGINGSARDYEAKEVYPPYRFVKMVGGKKLVPVYSGDRVIALVPAGSYLKQNRIGRARRRGIIPLPPANMAQLRRQTAFNPPSKKNLAVHLEFDQYQGNLMLDTSGHENHGMAIGAATRMVANYSCGMAERLIGGQISFNGTVFVPKPTVAVTVAVWVKLRSSKGRQSIFYTVGKGQYNLAAEDGKIIWSHMDDKENVSFKLITLYQYLKPNKWVHIAGTYDSVEGKSIT